MVRFGLCRMLTKTLSLVHGRPYCQSSVGSPKMSSSMPRISVYWESRRLNSTDDRVPWTLKSAEERRSYFARFASRDACAPSECYRRRLIVTRTSGTWRYFAQSCSTLPLRHLNTCCLRIVLLSKRLRQWIWCWWRQGDKCACQAHRQWVERSHWCPMLSTRYWSCAVLCFLVH